MPESSGRKQSSATRRAPAARTRLRQGALQRLVSNVDEVLYEVRFRKGTKGRVAFVSDSVKAILGYRPQEFLRHPSLWVSLLHPDDSAAAAEAQQRLRERPEGLVRIYRVRHKQTGEWRWMEDKVASRLDRSGRLIGLFGAARDVTERKRTEEALAESERRYRLLADNARDLIYRYRLVPTPGFEYVSPSATAMGGYTPEEYYANPSLGFEIVHPDDRPRLEALLQLPDALRDPITLRWRRKDGTWIWMELHSRPVFDQQRRWIAIEGIARDVTERALALEALRESELLFRAVFEGVDEAVVVVTPDRRILDMNGPAERMLGHSRDQLRGASTEVGHVDHQHFVEFGQRIAAAFTLGESAHFDFELKRRGGEIFPTEHTVSLLKGATGEPIGIVSVIRDITERRKAEAMLRASGERLQALSRHLLEVREMERRKLARGLHDDIGQLLTAVRLNIQTAQRTTGTETAAGLLDESLAVIDKGIDAVRGLALDLRPPLLDDLGLAAALRWYLNRHAAAAGLAASLVTDGLKCRPPADVETACFRVAQEAVTNVVRHASARNVEVEVRCEDGWADLFIRDDGVGFDVAERARHTESVGLLGMRERVLLLGGEITIDSAPERGTTVWARIPVPKGTA